MPWRRETAEKLSSAGTDKKAVETVEAVKGKPEKSE